MVGEVVTAGMRTGLLVGLAEGSFVVIIVGLAEGAFVVIFVGSAVVVAGVGEGVGSSVHVLHCRFGDIIQTKN